MNRIARRQTAPRRAACRFLVRQGTVTAPAGECGAEDAPKNAQLPKKFFGVLSFPGYPSKEENHMATARKARAEETPGYCKTDDLANLFGLTRQWINQLTGDGVLKRRDTPAGKRYNVVESVRAYTQYLRDKAAGRAEKGIPEDKELEKFDAEVRIKRAKAQIAELEAQEVQGLMHRSEDVAAMTEDLIYTIRGSLMALPGRLAADVVNVRTAAEAAVVIRTEVYKLMDELSQHRYDPQKYEERVRNRMKWESGREVDGDDE